MKLHRFLPWLLLASLSHAAPAFENLLSLPIEKRAEEFKNLGQSGIQFLSEAAFDHKNSMQMRWRALTTMGRLDPARFKKELDRALTSGEWFMRNAALIALQNDDRKRAIDWSLRLLNDPALVVRTQAVRNLIQLEAREAEPRLWAQIFSKNNFRGKEGLWVRVHLAEALARFTSPGRTKDFQRLLMDPDVRLHKWAIQGLENTTGIIIGDPKVPVEVRRRQWLERLGIQEI